MRTALTERNIWYNRAQSRTARNWRFEMRFVGYSLALAALVGLVGCNEESNPCRPQPMPLEGLYQSGDLTSGGTWNYLRFYADGTVLEAATQGTPEEVEKWLRRDSETQYPRGCYTVTSGPVTGGETNSTLQFSLHDWNNEYRYKGTIAADGLELTFESEVDGRHYTGYTKYHHVLVSGAGTTSGQNGEGKAATSDTRTARLGEFRVKIPAMWVRLGESEEANFRRQFRAQQKQIFQEFSSEDNPSSPIDIAAFQLERGDGHFVIASFKIPPLSDLIGLLMSQVKAKMDFGVQHGYIDKYLGLARVDYDELSGFYTKAIGAGGSVEVSGGLVHKTLKDRVIQFTLLCPRAWSQDKATNTLTAILKSVATGPK
jgi:hypothetical protein